MPTTEDYANEARQRTAELDARLDDYIRGHVAMWMRDTVRKRLLEYRTLNPQGALEMSFPEQQRAMQEVIRRRRQP